MKCSVRAVTFSSNVGARRPGVSSSSSSLPIVLVVVDRIFVDVSGESRSTSQIIEIPEDTASRSCSSRHARTASSSCSVSTLFHAHSHHRSASGFRRLQCQPTTPQIRPASWFHQRARDFSRSCCSSPADLGPPPSQFRLVCLTIILSDASRLYHHRLHRVAVRSRTSIAHATPPLNSVPHLPAVTACDEADHLRANAPRLPVHQADRQRRHAGHVNVAPPSISSMSARDGFESDGSRSIRFVPSTLRLPILLSYNVMQPDLSTLAEHPATK